MVHMSSSAGRDQPCQISLEMELDRYWELQYVLFVTKPSPQLLIYNTVRLFAHPNPLASDQTQGLLHAWQVFCSPSHIS